MKTGIVHLLIKRFLILLALIALILPLGGRKALADHERGNGIDVPESQGPRAWFPNWQRHIRYCAELDPRIGISQVELARMLEWAFEEWATYVEESGLKQDLNARFAGFGLATVAEPVECDGSEDVRFLIGKSNSSVESRRAEFKAPIALAVRSSTDPVTGWSTGWIWVSGDIHWGSLNALRGVLLHEIGHAFGFDHAPGTIMTSQFARFLEANPTDWEINLETLRKCFSSIEHSRDLYVSSSKTFQYNGEVAPDQTYGHRWELFSMVTGSVFEPGTIAQFSIDTDPSGKRQGTLLFTDSKTTYRLTIDLQPIGETVSVTLGEEPVFSAAPEPGHPEKVFRYFDRATMTYGTLRVGQTDYDVVVEHNQNATSDAQPLFPVPMYATPTDKRARLRGPVRVKVRTTPGHWETLFVAKPFQ